MRRDTSTLQIYHCSNHLHLSERKSKNFQYTEKVGVNAFFFTVGVFTRFRYLNTMV